MIVGRLFCFKEAKAACGAATDTATLRLGKQEGIFLNLAFCMNRGLSMSAKIVAGLMLLGAACAQASMEWKPLAPEALTLSAPRVEKDAAAEVLFKEITVTVDMPWVSVSEYAQIKVFSEKGWESATITIPYVDKEKVREVRGRTIKPGGKIVPLAADAIFDRTVVKTSGHKIKVTSFALPDVEAGDIIEYYWCAKEEFRPYYRLDIQGDIPAEQVRVVMKKKERKINFQWVYVALPTPSQRDSDGTTLEFKNVPAGHKEPLMPPEAMTHGWILVTLGSLNELSFRDGQFAFLKGHLKVGGEIRRAAQRIVGSATSDEEKLRRLYEYCQAQIHNTSLTEDDDDVPASRKANYTTGDTLRRGAGTATDIKFLFAALARAAGLDARWALLPDGGEVIYDRRVMSGDPFFFTATSVAVRSGDSWRFFDPATPHLPFGMLRWQEEGQPAVLYGEEKMEVDWVRTPVTPASKTARRRVGLVRLAADGTLEGDIHIGYTGHLALEKRLKMTRESEQEWLKRYADGLRSRWKGAEVENLRIQNRDGAEQPLLIQFHLRVPGFASRTGKRLFFQPALFEAGETPPLTAKTREHPVYFHFGWSAEDQYNFNLPEGYTLDNGDRPAPFAAPWMGLRYEVLASSGKLASGNSAITYHRNLTFGAGGWMLVPTMEYDDLKKVLDTLQENDNHVFALKQGTLEAAR